MKALTSLSLNITLLATTINVAAKLVKVLNHSSSALKNLCLTTHAHYTLAGAQIGIPDPPFPALDLDEVLPFVHLGCLTTLHLEKISASPTLVAKFLSRTSALEKLSFSETDFPLFEVRAGSLPNLQSIGRLTNQDRTMPEDVLEDLTRIQPIKLKELFITGWFSRESLLDLGDVAPLERIHWPNVDYMDSGRHTRRTQNIFLAGLGKRLPNFEIFDVATGHLLLNGSMSMTTTGWMTTMMIGGDAKREDGTLETLILIDGAVE
jgi:hypothetical protein